MFRFKSKANKEQVKQEMQTLSQRFVIILIFSFIMAFLIKFLALESLNDIKVLLSLNSMLQTLALGIIWCLMLFSVQLYILNNRKKLFAGKKLPIMILVCVFVTFIFSAVAGNYFSVFSMPLALAGLLIATVVDDRVGFIVNILINQVFFVSYILLFGNVLLIDSATAMIAGTISGTLMIYSLKKAYSRLKFLINGLIIGVIMIPIAMLSALISPSETLVTDLLKNGFWAFFSVVLTIALYNICLPIIEKSFRLYTNFHLDEICSFDNVLLKRLYNEAPGTFSHSMVVSNLAQACAQAIGENAQLARAAACYHDVGKLNNPTCFVENQVGTNPHDDFIPEVSVQLITNHTENGYKLCKEAKLPDIIAEVALQHHGTTPVDYFYNKVKNITEEDLERDDFCYSGPKPQTKIAAIVMICDTAEAATRAVGIMSNPNDFQKFIHGLINNKQKIGQFDDCEMTFRELSTIENTLVRVLPTMYHNRISYDNK